MNDDFLHRLRAEPSAKFLATLKATLERQAMSHARRTLFRTAILATLIGGSAVAVAFVAWKGIPESVRVAAHISNAQDRSWQSKNIISAPSGGGAPKVITPAGDGGVPASAAMVRTAPTEPAAQPSTGPNQMRAVFSVAGPTAIVLNAQEVVRRPVETGMIKQPTFTITSTTDAIAMLCHVRASTGPHPGFADIAGASRRMLPAELEACRSRGLTRLAELHSGYETVVLARSKLYGAPKLSARDIFLALAAEVPDPNRLQSLIKNPYRVWNAIDTTLSEDKIEILGPPPASATAAAFRQTLMEAGCTTFPWLAALKQSDLKRYERVCRTVREDGIYRKADGSLIAHLETYPNAMALLNYGEVMAKPDALAAASVDGVEPSIESITAERYAGSRAMYLYVNKDRVYNVSGMFGFIDMYARSLDSTSFGILVPPPAQANPRQANAAKYLILADLKL
jgi:phosphate transport system substrate-binding protein